MNDPVFALPPDLDRHLDVVTTQSAVSWELEPEEETKRFIDVTMGGLGLVISVNDTGVDADHPALDGIQLVGKRDFTGSRRGTQDVDGHGTFVLGQIYRLLPRAKYLVAKVLGDNGSGSSIGILRGNEWAAGEGAHAINESLGSPQAFKQKADWLATWDGLLWAASGNSGRQGIIYPANNGIELGVIPCGSYGPNGGRSNFSTWGSRLQCLGAGERIVGPRAGGGQTTMSGTSMGTPDALATGMGYVSGLWGAGFGDVNGPEGIRGLVTAIATDMDQAGHDFRTGHGKLERKTVITQLEKLDGGPL